MKGKIKISILLLALLLVLTGCGKSGIPLEDFVQTNPASATINNIMKSDTGYYYGANYGKEMSLHYYDVVSGQNIYLCSKPECRHDGDAFCTATSSKYTVNSTYFYGGSLYLDVTEFTDTECLYRLLRVSEDGSELTEIVTYMTVNTTTMMAVSGQPMMIHRGVAVLPYWLASIGDPDIGVTGTCLYNLETGELTQLPELTYGIGNTGRKRFIGYGDHIYFSTLVDRKNILSRYCLKDGTVEELELNNFGGIYSVADEDTIYYYYSGQRLFEYKISTKETIEYKEAFLKRTIKPIKDDDETDNYIYGYEVIEQFECADMMTDGTYLYVGENMEFHNISLNRKMLFSEGRFTEEVDPAYVHVFDRELKEIARISISTKELLGYYEYFSLKILDDMVYVQTSPTVFQCTLEEFLTGEPVFTPVYNHETKIQSTKDGYW